MTGYFEIIDSTARASIGVWALDHAVMAELGQQGA